MFSLIRLHIRYHGRAQKCQRQGAVLCGDPVFAVIKQGKTIPAIAEYCVAVMAGFIKVTLVLPRAVGWAFQVSELDFLDCLPCIYRSREGYLQNLMPLSPVHFCAKFDSALIPCKNNLLLPGKICFPPVDIQMYPVPLPADCKRPFLQKFLRNLLVHSAKLPGIVIHINIPVKTKFIKCARRIFISALLIGQA